MIHLVGQDDDEVATSFPQAFGGERRIESSQILGQSAKVHKDLAFLHIHWVKLFSELETDMTEPEVVLRKRLVELKVCSAPIHRSKLFAMSFIGRNAGKRVDLNAESIYDVTNLYTALVGLETYVTSE
jgi:hypothetical protein